MGAYESTVGVTENDYNIQICLKKNDTVVKYILKDKSQVAKKEVTSLNGSSMIFDVDLVTESMSYHGMSCGMDGDFVALQESLLSMVKEIRECVNIESKPIVQDEMNE